MRYIIVILFAILCFYLGYRSGHKEPIVKTIIDSSYIIKSDSLKVQNKALIEVSNSKDKQITDLKNRRMTINKVYKDTIINILDTIIYTYELKDSLSELRIAKLESIISLKEAQIKDINLVNTNILKVKDSVIDSLIIANIGLHKKIKRTKTLNKVKNILFFGLGIFTMTKL